MPNIQIPPFSSAKWSHNNDQLTEAVSTWTADVSYPIHAGREDRKLEVAFTAQVVSSLGYPNDSTSVSVVPQVFGSKMSEEGSDTDVAKPKQRLQYSSKDIPHPEVGIFGDVTDDRTLGTLKELLSKFDAIMSEPDINKREAPPTYRALQRLSGGERSALLAPQDAELEAEWRMPKRRARGILDGTYARDSEGNASTADNE
jgi:hypothetical protein